MALYPLKRLQSGHIMMDSSDNCKAAAQMLEIIRYKEDFCLSIDFNPLFIASCMAAGFLVMSSAFNENEEEETESKESERFFLLPKHHLIRSCLFFPELHIKKNIRRKLNDYELCFDKDFDLIVEKCVKIHGSGWLTEPFLRTIREIRTGKNMPVRPVSFALYRDGVLAAGEFGIVSGRVYTSYSGYFEEDNAGTIQMILTAKWLEKSGYAFWDLGMPLDYKLTIGAREITREEFMKLFFDAQDKDPQVS